MKTKLCGGLITLYFLLTAMHCDEDYYCHDCVKVNLVGIELTNLDNTGEYPVIAKDSIKKEAYVIGLKYKVVTETEPLDTVYYDRNIHYNKNLDYYQYKDQIQIYCNTDFNTEYTAGNNITKLFTISKRYEYDKSIILRTAPQSGTHSFNIHYNLDSIGTIQENTKPIKLY